MTELHLSKRVEGMYNPATRDIMKLLERPEIISFAGGFPSADGFPVTEIKLLAGDILSRIEAETLQYGPTKGDKALIKFLAGWLQESKNIHTTEEEIQITSGSQQGLELACKLFLDEGDRLAVENPTYLSAFQIFNSYQVSYLPVPCDERGMQVERLETALATHKPKLVYTVATFQNPTGISLSAERREKLLYLADKHDFLIIEDNPYGELRYDGEELPTLKSLDRSGRVIYLGSFSKIIAPGLRVGYLVARPEITDKITIAKQAADVHTCNLSQQIIYEFCRHDYLEPHLNKICREYRKKRDTMLKALYTYFPTKVQWTHPEGGLFIWAQLPENIDSNELLEKAVSRGVAFVPGNSFFIGNSGYNTMRLNFSNTSPELIDKGIRVIGQLIKEMINEAT